MLDLRRVVVECVNVEAVEEKIAVLRTRIREIDIELMAENNTERRVALEGEWVESHMHILNYRHMVQVKLDAILQKMLDESKGADRYAH